MTPDSPAPDEQQPDLSNVPAPWSLALPHITTTMSPDEVSQSAYKLSTKGKLAGYAKSSDGFSADVFGTLYDRTLHATVSASSEGSEIRFASTLNKKFPVIVIVAFLFTLWPGVYFTDSLLSTWFSWYRLSIWMTSAWYIPLTLLAVPVLLKQYKQSELAGWIHAHETIDTLGVRFQGEVHPVEY